MSGSKAVLRAAFAVLLSAAFAACSLITDFDESKIPKDVPDASMGGASAGGASGGFAGGGGAGGAGGVPSGGTNSGGVTPSSGGSGGGSGGDIGSGGDVGSGGTGPGPVCDVDTNEGCGDDEICCEVGQDVICRKTSTDECEACGVACPDGLTSACVARKCECAPGAGRACSGADAERFCVEGPPAACAECRDATDCAGRTDGKTRCVAGACAVCDPSQNSAGCAGNTPICDAATKTCKACTVTPDDCPGALVCTASGACGNCASAADCPTPTTPICEPSTTQCRACGSHAECVAQTSRPFCSSGTCSTCTPQGDQGCTDPTKPDCRGAPGGGFACQACINTATCLGRAGTPVCDVDSGRCVACVTDNDCAGNARAPLCSNNVCVACDTVSILPQVSDARCALKAGGEPVCIRTGTQKGECGACDPGPAHRGCTTSQLCCESGGAAACVATSPLACSACTGGACNPLLANTCSNRGCRCGTGAACTGTGASRFCTGAPAACEECRNDADCTSPTEPLCEGGACVGCHQAASANARCAAETTGAVCSTAGTLVGRCTACDPGTGAGCGGTLNQCSPATSTCVDCVNDQGCSGAFGQCNVAAQTCVDCVNDQGCSGALGQCHLASFTCVDCVDDGGCEGTQDQCNVTTRTCVDCDATGGCAPADRCQLATNTCVDCDATGGCAAADRCLLTTNTCVDCDATGGCSGVLDRCDVPTHTCVDCDATGGCTDSPVLPICGGTQCRACASDAECAAAPGAAGPLCASTGACVADAPCTLSVECTDANHPVCANVLAGGGTGVCRRCDPETGAGCGVTQTCTAQFACTG